MSSVPPPPPSTVADPVPAAVPPGGLVTADDMAQAAAAVAGMSAAEQAGSVIISDSSVVDPGTVAALHLGGIIILGSQGEVNGTSSGTPEEVAALTADYQTAAGQPGLPLLIGTDQESGLVTRLVNGFTEFPGADELSEISDLAAAAAATQAVTAASAAEMLAVGINVDFAPDADVVPESGLSGVAGRTFGSDPDRTAALVAASVRGYQSAGLAATVKHFPGIGRLDTDTHKALPALDIGCDEWNAVEAVPMRAGVDAGTALVMIGHVEMPAVGAVGQSTALSRDVVTDLLHGNGTGGCNGLNFQGIAISDSFVMAPILNNFDSAEAAWRGLDAGLDVVLMPKDAGAAVDGIVTAMGNGSLDPARVAQAATRVYALRMALARSPRPGMDVVNSAEHNAIAADARAQG